jgi:hypothetical protein
LLLVIRYPLSVIRYLLFVIISVQRIYQIFNSLIFNAYFFSIFTTNPNQEQFCHSVGNSFGHFCDKEFPPE